MGGSDHSDGGGDDDGAKHPEDWWGGRGVEMIMVNSDGAQC